jgi:hypothetical protein
MAEFMCRQGTEPQCEASQEVARRPDSFACRVCGGQASCSFRRQFRLYRCATCRHQCSVISRKMFESTKLPLTRWLPAAPFHGSRLEPRSCG